MALDLFSCFDDHNKVLMDLYMLVWLMMLGMVMTTTNKNKHMMSYFMTSYIYLMISSSTMVASTKLQKMCGSKGIIMSLFLLFAVMNTQGTLPYTMGLTSHIAIAFSMAMPLWLSFVLMSSTYSLSSYMAHLLPVGSPAYLNPFLCLIELVSLMIRPLTLTVRVVANLSTGHILIGLLASSSISSSVLMSMITMLMGILYMIFELAVCLIQAYIFTLLPTLYGDEHTDLSIY